MRKQYGNGSVVNWKLMLLGLNTDSDTECTTFGPSPAKSKFERKRHSV